MLLGKNNKLCGKEEKLTGLSCQTMMTLSSSPDASRLPSGLHLNSYNIIEHTVGAYVRCFGSGSRSGTRDS